MIDEAHRLRNVYKPSNVIANTLKLALGEQAQAAAHGHAAAELPAGTVRPGQLHRRARFRRPEELPRAVRQSRPRSRSFRPSRRASSPSAIARCAARSPPTSRSPSACPLVEEFTPEESEDRLYDLVSEYLRRDNLQALPASQRSLMTLVLRKLLASSTFAIAGALDIDFEPAESQAARSRSRRNRSKTNWTRITKRSTKPPRNGRKTSPPNRFPMPTAPPLKRRSPTWTPSPGSPRPSTTTPRARRCSRRLTVAFAKADELGRRAKGHHLHRIAANPELSAARAGRQPVCGRHRPVQRLQHRRPLQADLRRVAGAPSRHRPRHRLANRRHALGPGGLFPRSRAAS